MAHVDDTFLRQLELREDDLGRLLPFLGGLSLPGVQSVEVRAEANIPRICEIRIRLIGDAFKLVAYADDEPRGAILR